MTCLPASLFCFRDRVSCQPSCTGTFYIAEKDFFLLHAVIIGLDCHTYAVPKITLGGLYMLDEYSTAEPYSGLSLGDSRQV